MEAGTEAQISTSRPVPGRAGFHGASLQLYTSVGLTGCGNDPGAWPRSQTSRTEQQEVIPRGGVGSMALEASFLWPNLALSLQFLLAGRRQSWETVLVSYSLGDELSKSFPLSRSPFPLQWNQVSSSSTSPTHPLCMALTDTDFLLNLPSGAPV